MPPTIFTVCHHAIVDAIMKRGTLMVRTQVQLTENQLKALRQVAAATGRSIADLIRQAVDQYLAAKQGPNPQERMERAIRVAGRFSSGTTDGSTDHNRYLAEAFEP